MASRSHLALFAASLVVLIAASPAFAAQSPPPVTPSIDQYVETVPTSSGGTAPGVGKAHVTRLPRGLVVRLHRRHDTVAQRLEAIATSSLYGAPQRDLIEPSVPNATVTDRSALAAAVTAVDDPGDSHIYWLIAGLTAVTCILGVAARQL